MDGTDSDVVDEHELDEALEQASGLAAELANQLNDGETPTTPPDTDESAPETSSTTNLEDQLEELEDLVAAARGEIGADLGEDDQAPSGSSTEPAVPDFMDEFTQPEAPSESAPPSSASPSSSDTGVSGSAPSEDGDQGLAEPSSEESPELESDDAVSIGVVGTSALRPQNEASRGLKPAAQVETAANSLAVPILVAKLRSVAGPVAERLASLAITVCGQAVALCELADRPFTRLSSSLRRVIGWVAIATAGTTVVVYFTSLF